MNSAESGDPVMLYPGEYLLRLPRQTRAVLQTCLYGLGAGMATVAFQLGINWVYQLGLGTLSHRSMGVFMVGSFVGIVSSSLAVGWLLNSFCGEAAGSGIPQLKLAFWKDFGSVPWRVAWVKFVAGILSIGGGASLGREGPSVQLAGAVGSNLAGLLGEAKQNRRAAAAAGAAAGLAAAFNTPLAATTFVLEEIIGDLNSRFLGGVLLASVLGALVVHGVIGKQPSFSLHGVDAPSWTGYALTPVVAALAALVGIGFQRAALGLRRRLKARGSSRSWLLPVAGALITWILGATVYWRTGRLGVFSLGYDDLSSALAGDLGWQLAAVLLLTKFVATFSCYGFGGCGGIFSPTLFFGGMMGVLVAGLLNIEWTISRADTVALAVVGMSACLGAVVGAPVTGILIVFEMTHEFALVPALMIGALVSQTLRRRMNRHNFYEALLDQDGHRIEHVRPPRDLTSWQRLPVSALANFHAVIVENMERDVLRSLLRSHPYQRFPVTRAGRLAGILTRGEADKALTEGREPRLEPAVTCSRNQTIQDLQQLLIDSTTQFLVVMDEEGKRVLGVVTLHDLLRSQAAAAEQYSDA
ncbi:MAG TPA: chloride channel protein [Candidatus Paceibacterota bacterium]|nr:chloride channel protein [Candidatus Paceibacterota bacterium]